MGKIHSLIVALLAISVVGLPISLSYAVIVHGGVLSANIVIVNMIWLVWSWGVHQWMLDIKTKIGDNPKGRKKISALATSRPNTTNSQKSGNE